jgi:hypothetical protein
MKSIKVPGEMRETSRMIITIKIPLRESLESNTFLITSHVPEMLVGVYLRTNYASQSSPPARTGAVYPCPDSVEIV